MFRVHPRPGTVSLLCCALCARGVAPQGHVQQHLDELDSSFKGGIPESRDPVAAQKAMCTARAFVHSKP